MGVQAYNHKAAADADEVHAHVTDIVKVLRTDHPSSSIAQHEPDLEITTNLCKFAHELNVVR